jgi:hypothetical protein
MRDRILSYLISAGGPQTSDQILRAVLKIHSPNLVSADTVLRSIIEDDHRFHFEDGLWRPAASSREKPEKGFDQPVALFIQRPDVKAHALCMRGGLYRMDTGEALEFDLSRSLQGLDMNSLLKWRAAAESRGLLVWAGDSVRLWDQLLQSCRMERQEGCVFSLRSLAARMLTRLSPKPHLEELGAELGIPAPDLDRPGRVAQFMSTCLESLLERVPTEHRVSFKSLMSWIDDATPRVDFSRIGFGKDFLRQLPHGPGVYVMRNRAADIIYVGKAGNLRRRISSYFTSRALSDPKVARIHDQLRALETIPTPSELDALLLETQMIRDFRPSVNLQIEVHEQPAGYGKHRNLVLLAARPEAGTAEVYFLRSGVFVGQQPVRLGKPAPRSLQAKIRSIYFPARERSRKGREAWEMEIVSRWLTRNRRRINFVDIDDAGDYETAVRQLDQYLRDPDRLSKKVLYR